MLTGSQDTFDPQLTQRFPGLTRVGTQIERAMKGHRHRPGRGQYFFHPRDIDLAIGSYNSQVHNIISEPLYREQHWLYCSDLHPMFFSRQLDKEQISQCPLVTRSYWNTSDLRRRGFSKGSATVETVDAQLLLILSGKYIGYLPEHYAWPWIKENRLRVLLPNEFGFQSPFSAICKRGRSNEPYLKAFRDLLKKNTVARPKWNY